MALATKDTKMENQKLLMTQDVATRLKYYTELAAGEISGIGKTILTEDKDILIVDILLFEQECTSSTTDIDDKALAKFQYDMSKAGEDLSEWNLWWHTHHNFAVSWSSTDDKTINGHSEGYDYLVSLVTNKAGDYLGRLDVFPKDSTPFGKTFNGVRYDLPVDILINEETKMTIEKTIDTAEQEKEALKDMIKELDDVIERTKEALLTNEEVEEACKEEVKEKVRSKVYNLGGHATRSPYYYNPPQQSFLDYKKKEDQQEGFGEVIEEIEGGYSEYEEEDYQLDDFDICDECQNPIYLCECENAREKWGFLYNKDLNVNDYLDREFYKNHYRKSYDL